MGKSKAKDLTIKMIICPDDKDIEGIVHSIEAKMREAARLDGGDKRPAESTHAFCHCGGGPIIFPSGHVPGEKSDYNIRCGRCGREPLFGQYEPGKRPPAHIDFSSEGAALAVWDAVMGAGLSNG